MAKKTTQDASRIIGQMIGNDPGLREPIERETLNAQVARTIYEARTAAGLTQAELARLVGSTQSAIARLEDAEYEGHSLTMLRRVAKALFSLPLKTAKCQSPQQE